MTNMGKGATASNRNFNQRSSSKAVQSEKDAKDFINPMDFWDDDINLGETQVVENKGPELNIRGKGFFVIGTDSGVGKTITICSLGTLLQQQQIQVAAFKPIECGGEDNRIFIDSLGLEDFTINHDIYSSKEKEDPYFIFKKSKEAFDFKKVQAVYEEVSRNHALTFVEAPGGLLDPITEGQTTADLAAFLKLDIIIVASLKSGILNQLMMIHSVAKEKGLMIRGVLFTVAEKNISKEIFLKNVQAVQDVVKIPVIGFIPFLEKGSREEVIEKCYKKISFKVLLGQSFPDIKPPEKKEEAQNSVQDESKKKPTHGRRRRHVRKAPPQK